MSEQCAHQKGKMVGFDEETFQGSWKCKLCGEAFSRKASIVCMDDVPPATVEAEIEAFVASQAANRELRTTVDYIKAWEERKGFDAGYQSCRSDYIYEEGKEPCFYCGKAEPHMDEAGTQSSKPSASGDAVREAVEVVTGALEDIDEAVCRAKSPFEQEKNIEFANALRTLIAAVTDKKVSTRSLEDAEKQTWGAVVAAYPNEYFSTDVLEAFKTTWKAAIEAALSLPSVSSEWVACSETEMTLEEDECEREECHHRGCSCGHAECSHAESTCVLPNCCECQCSGFEEEDSMTAPMICPACNKRCELTEAERTYMLAGYEYGVLVCPDCYYEIKERG